VGAHRYNLSFAGHCGLSGEGDGARLGLYVVFRHFEELFSTALEFPVEEGASLEFFWEVLFDH